jgi:predicted DsbA family dithiol-disulfide isomerase
MSDKENATINIDIVSDVMCPWCFIGKRNIESAVAGLEGIDVTINWRPFQLDPTLPPEGKDRAKYLSEKFGGEEGARTAYKRVEDAGKTAGIDFNFNAIAVSPNTLDAHRLIRWAGGVSREVQDRVVTRLFELYFEEGANIGDHDILCSVAEGAGMDPAIVRDLLASDADRDAVRQEIAAAQRMGVTGVPCFILDQRYAVMGAQPPEVIAQAIRQASAERREEAEYAAE